MLAYDWNFLGLSLEAKPTAGEKVVDGSTFYECDTCDFYIFYQGRWYKQTFVTEDGINFSLYNFLMKKMFGKLFDTNITTAKIIKPDTGTNIEFTTSLPAQIIELTGYGDTKQDGTPTPSSPVDIDVVTGVQNVKVCGKNLLKIPDGSFVSQGLTVERLNNTITVSGKYTGSSSYKSLLNSSGTTVNLDIVLPAGTYTISLSQAPAKRLEVSLYNSSNVRICHEYLDGTYSTFTLTEKATGIRLYINGLSQNLDVDSNYTNLQIEAGSTPTTYEPYQSQSYTVDLGSTELCKLGDYQDYIYKSGDDWYLHKETATIASYDGESISTDYLSTTGQLTTGATVYYVLNTPTDTKITDATLTSQLNALLKYTFPVGVNTIVITAYELPMPLKLIISEKE